VFLHQPILSSRGPLDAEIPGGAFTSQQIFGLDRSRLRDVERFMPKKERAAIGDALALLAADGRLARE